MKTTTYFLLVALTIAFVVLFVGCNKPEKTVAVNANIVATKPGAVDSSTGNASPFHAEFATTPEQLKAGEPMTLTITVRDAQGNVVRDLDLSHEKPIHLIVVSDDLADFQHVHPELQADGAYSVSHTFPNGGAYRLYADYTPLGASQIIDRHDLKVAGNERAHVPLVEDKSTIKSVGGLRVTMRADKPLRAGQEVLLNFSVDDAKTGKPVTDLQPYLGAPAHFVIIDQELTDFLHVHPMEAGAQMAGMDHGAMQDSHAESAGGERKNGASPSEIAAHTTLPRPGLYKVWGQFQRNGQVITVPFVVRVAT